MTDLLHQLMQVYVNTKTAIPALRSGDPAFYKMVAPPLQRANQALASIIKRYAHHGAQSGMAHPLPIVDPDPAIKKAADILSNSRVMPAYGPAKQKALTSAKKIRQQLAQKAYMSLRLLQKHMPPNGWTQFSPYVAEVHEAIMTGSSTESKRRRTVSLAEKLAGRIALMEGTGGISREVSTACLANKHGKRLAGLVARGSKYAIDLVGLMEERTLYHASTAPALAVLAEYDNYIGRYRRALGLTVLAEESAISYELINLMRLAAGAGFASHKHFQQHLCEGLLLNINTLASKALSIPSGEYVVWLTDAGHTMLVPTSEDRAGGDVVSEAPAQQFDILTPKLVGCWNKLERVLGDQVIGERGEKVRDFKTDKSGEGGNKREPRVTKSHEGLPNLRRAREQAGLSLSDVSDRTGLAVSTIAKHELGYANPLHGSMEKIMGALDVDPGAFHKPGAVEPYAHLDPSADEFDPYNVDVDHAGAGHHGGGSKGNKKQGGGGGGRKGDGHKGAHGPMVGASY